MVVVVAEGMAEATGQSDRRDGVRERDEHDSGIYLSARTHAVERIPPPIGRESRLGYYLECGPEDRSTPLPVRGADATMDELYVISGVY